MARDEWTAAPSIRPGKGVRHGFGSHWLQVGEACDAQRRKGRAHLMHDGGHPAAFIHARSGPSALPYCPGRAHGLAGVPFVVYRTGHPRDDAAPPPCHAVPCRAAAGDGPIADLNGSDRPSSSEHESSEIQRDRASRPRLLQSDFGRQGRARARPPAARRVVARARPGLRPGGARIADHRAVRRARDGHRQFIADAGRCPRARRVDRGARPVASRQRRYRRIPG